MSSPRSGGYSPSSPGYPSPNDYDDDHDPVTEEEDGEELIHDNMAVDYQYNAELDHYDDRDLAEEEDVEVDYEARAAAERELQRREALSHRRGKRAAALHLDDDEDMDYDMLQTRRRRLGLHDGADALMNNDDEHIAVDLDSYTGKLVDYLAAQNTQIEVRKRFRRFLTEYTEGASNSPIYLAKINEMCAMNAQSFEVSYTHLSQSQPTLSVWLLEQPETMLELFNIEAMTVVSTLYASYSSVHDAIYVRFTGMAAIATIRELCQKHLRSFIMVRGVVVRRTSVFPQLRQVKYECLKCHESIGPYVQTGDKEVKPSRCPACQSTGPFKVNMSETVYQDYQKITIQEAPGSMSAGRIPRQKDVILLHDLIDCCAPGEEVEVTGVYKHSFDQHSNRVNGFPLFSTIILANNIGKRNIALSSNDVGDDETRTILELSKKPNIASMIINSIAPSIYGHQHIKTAIAMSLFGGEAKEFENKHRLRGDINVLLLGDPGTAKSQFLKYVEKLAQRAVYTTGKGASAVGLTACVRMDPMTREWTLEGGALVLADQGTCLIDEFDKMSDQDRTSIHEAMEQQSISISKAGIVCTLKARCGVIAAANPLSGRYVNSKSFQEQVDLTEPILSRFDCLCVVRDIIDSENDRKLANFVVESHAKSHPDYVDEDEERIGDTTSTAYKEMERAALEARGQIPQDILRKYIAYARKHCHPKLHNIDKDKITKLYVDLRKAASTTGGIQITSRQIESLIRMAEAHAKMALREYVTNEDVDVAIRTMLESFISSQKLSVKNSLEMQFRSYITLQRDRFELLLDLLKDMVKSGLMLRQVNYKYDIVQARATPLEIRVEEFTQAAVNYGVADVSSFFQSPLFSEAGYEYDGQRKVLVCRFN